MGVSRAGWPLAWGRANEGHPASSAAFRATVSCGRGGRCESIQPTTSGDNLVGIGFVENLVASAWINLHRHVAEPGGGVALDERMHEGEVAAHGIGLADRYENRQVGTDRGDCVRFCHAPGSQEHLLAGGAVQAEAHNASAR